MGCCQSAPSAPSTPSTPSARPREPTPPSPIPMDKVYVIDRDIKEGPGQHLRRHSSVQRHLDAAPPVPQVTPPRNDRRYPKKFNNEERCFTGTETLFEYPTKEFPYDQQKKKGGLKGEGKNGGESSAGFTRTYVNRQKEIRGVGYHPFVPDRRVKAIVRAREEYVPAARR